MEIERQVVLTYLLSDDLTNGRHDCDGSDIDTIVAVMGTWVVDIRAAFGYVIAVLPSVRCLFLADRELLGKFIGVMHKEVQRVYTIATKV